MNQYIQVYKKYFNLTLEFNPLWQRVFLYFLNIKFNQNILITFFLPANIFLVSVQYFC